MTDQRSADDNLGSTETRITTLYTMHTQVSNLSELSWNYFLNSLPNRAYLVERPELMAKLYIPSRFLDRIH